MKIEVNKSYLNNNGQRVDICGEFIYDNNTHFIGVTTDKENQYGQIFDAYGNWVNEDISRKDYELDADGYKIAEEYRELLKKEFFIHTTPGDEMFDSIEKFTMKPNCWTKKITLEEIKEDAADNPKEGVRFYKITVEEYL